MRFGRGAPIEPDKVLAVAGDGARHNRLLARLARSNRTPIGIVEAV